MPELPEVEAARRAIEDHCIGKKIMKAIISDDPKVIDGGVSPNDFEASLIGKTVVAAHRKGKNMWLELDSPPFPSFQFGMAGAIYIKGVAITKYKRSAVKDTDEWPSKYSKFFIEILLLAMKKSKSKVVDPTWEHCEKIEEGAKSRLKLKCVYCKNAYWGGISRMKNHLCGSHKDVAACTKCPIEVAQFFKNLLEEKNDPDKEEDVEVLNLGGSRLGCTISGRTPTLTLNTMLKKADRDDICLDICRCFYANALPFNLVKDPYFIKMLESVASFGKGLKPPSYHEVRVSYLKKETEMITGGLLEKYRMEWKKTGCTIMSDGWTDGKHRSITNFLVNSPRGSVFLKSIDTSDICKNADNLFSLLDSIVEEIGEDNVVQVVTDSASAYVKAGEFLMAKRRKLFWSPYAAHCLDLILTDIGDLPIHNDTMTKAKKITVYIYRHSWVLSLMRKHTKKRELVRAGVTRFATSYLTLRSLHENKIGLTAMFGSEEWQRSSYSKKVDGLRVRDIILAEPNFWRSIKYCLKCVLPLVKVLRLVDGDVKPAMGYIYEAMDKAKEQIQQSFRGVKKNYQPIWDIIDTRWNMQLHRPLHAAAYFLNPRFHYSPDFNADYEIKMGLYDTIQRMCPSPILREKVDRQIDIFHNAEKMFGMDMAIQMRNKKQPALWWDSFGGGTLELQQLAIRILSLTCSATGCERNWSTFDQLDDGLELSFTDKRRFAKVRLLENPASVPPISELGPDALFEPMTIDGFFNSLSKKKIGIKALLLDQSFISGIGNWIADEVIYQARIHPLQTAASMSKENCAELHKCIKKVIEKAVEVGADSSQFPTNWICHFRDKKPGKAFVDGKKIEFINAGGRTTAYVPELQKLSGIQAEKALDKPQKGTSKKNKDGNDDATEPESEAEENAGSAKSKGGRKTATLKGKKRPAKRMSNGSDNNSTDDDYVGQKKKKTKGGKKPAAKRKSRRKAKESEDEDDDFSDGVDDDDDDRDPKKMKEKQTMMEKISKEKDGTSKNGKQPKKRVK